MLSVVLISIYVDFGNTVIIIADPYYIGILRRERTMISYEHEEELSFDEMYLSEDDFSYDLMSTEAKTNLDK